MHRLVGDEARAGKGRGVERHRDVVRDALADVRDRRVELEALAVAHDRRHGERHVEEGIADEHAAARLALDGHGAADQALEDGRDVEVERVEALALAAQQELGLALLAGARSGRRRRRCRACRPGPRPSMGIVSAADRARSRAAPAGRRRCRARGRRPAGSWIVPVTFLHARGRSPPARRSRRRAAPRRTASDSRRCRG